MKGAAVLLALAVAAAPAAACAVDRTLGAGIARPSAMGAGWSPGDRARLSADVDRLLGRAATLRGAHAGLLVLDSRTGAVLYGRNADDAFAPASTLKLLTGSAALARLGPTYRFRTRAFLASPAGAEATVEQGTAHGNLVVRGGGDPFLGDRDLDGLVGALRARGVARIEGDVVTDAGRYETAPYPPGWTWDDFAYGYAAPVSAASFEQNVVHLTVAPATAPGAAAVVTAAPLRGVVAPCAPGCVASAELRVQADAVTGAPGSADTVDVERDAAAVIHVRGSIPGGAPPDELDAAVPEPATYLRRAVLQHLADAGIAVTPPDPAPAARAVLPDRAGGLALWTHDGEELRDLLADMWWPSDNLAAELLLRETAVAAFGEPGTLAHGSALGAAWLRAAGADPAGATLADGSGLSAYDRLAPRALAAVLQADWNGPHRDLVIDDLPLAGVRGTLKSRFGGTLAAKRAFLKTGSMNHTRGLAGYLATLHHGAVTVAWSVDDWLGNDADLGAVQGAVLARIIGAP
ncbi:MAG: D-alanyl-D-alanine carboxypeptidase/D-alanyl-D-alanine-endopeptidase [Candidatus Velthaea sp.]